MRRNFVDLYFQVTDTNFHGYGNRFPGSRVRIYGATFMDFLRYACTFPKTDFRGFGNGDHETDFRELRERIPVVTSADFPSYGNGLLG